MLDLGMLVHILVTHAALDRIEKPADGDDGCAWRALPSTGAGSSRWPTTSTFVETSKTAARSPMLPWATFETYWGVMRLRAGTWTQHEMPDIKPERVLSDLRTLATFGAYKTGVHRPTLSEQDIAAREWFVGRMREAGLDAVNRRHCQHPSALSPATGRKALAGSHLESQNHAGWLDGPLGCVYALEAARAIAEDRRDEAPRVDVVVFCDEEGHFGSFLGSRSFIGLLEESEIDAACNRATGMPHARGVEDRRLVGRRAPCDRSDALRCVLRSA